MEVFYIHTQSTICFGCLGRADAFMPRPAAELSSEYSERGSDASELSPPRPLASRRVDAPTNHQTLQTSQNLQNKLLGGGFTLLLAPPRRLGSES